MPPSPSATTCLALLAASARAASALLPSSASSAVRGGLAASLRRSVRPPTLRRASSSADRADVEAKIRAVGDEIRAAKASGADAAGLVAELLELKAVLDPSVLEKKEKKRQKNRQTPKRRTPKGGGPADDAESDYITPRSENFSKWYSDVIRCADLAEASPVRGCLIIKPWGMSLWDATKNDLDGRIREHGAENAYFPLLIPRSFLSKEAEHVDGFAKECAVVTHHRLAFDGESGELRPDPEAVLEDPLIVRPTSETAIWSSFKNWISSHRDLPLKINQWANVMRWEMRTRPFLRTSEFLWQEGHTAHATAEEARGDAEAVLEIYAGLARETLAMPVVRGTKSPSERFAGAEETLTIEAMMQNGWALQSGTSHYLGTSFAKAFDVTFQDKDGAVKDVYGSSWGVSTRLLGALIMTHSDDKGLVLPPKVAPFQAVIVPIAPKKKDVEAVAAMEDALDRLVLGLKEKGVRVKVDDRDHLRNGAKYFEWERKGVPLRVELGPRDLAKGVCVFKYRDGDEKEAVALDVAAAAAAEGLDGMQTRLYDAASAALAGGTTMDATYEEMKAALTDDEASTYPGAGLFLVPWKCDAENEAKIKEECKATIRCYPIDLNQRNAAEGKKCFYSGEDATHMALFGRAF